MAYLDGGYGKVYEESTRRGEPWGMDKKTAFPAEGTASAKTMWQERACHVIIMGKSSVRPPGLRIHSLCKGKLLKVLCDLCLQNQKGNLHNAPILGEEKTVSSKVLVAAAATLLSNVIPEGSRYSNPNHLNLALKLFF